MIDEKTIALLLSRRQKRHTYWSEIFANTRLHSQTASAQLTQANALLSTYALLITKLANATDESEISETDDRMLSIERDLSSLFESYRLLTSELHIR